MDPSPPLTKQKKVSHLLVMVILVAAGLVANAFPFELIFNIQFIFGSIFAMLALLLFGLTRGVLAAAVISSFTYIAWDHPYAIIIMTAEVLAVGLLHGRKKIGFVLCDALYWLVLGTPLVVLFYYGVMHLPLYNVTITALKQSTNGIANALIARLVFVEIARIRKYELVSLRETTFNLLVLFCLLPSLLLISRSSRNELVDLELAARQGLVMSGQRTEQQINAWLFNHLRRVELLSWAAEITPVPAMQRYFERTLAVDDDFLRMGLLDRNATIVAYAPLVDEMGQRNIGKSFRDRPFIPILQKTLKPMLSEVVMGRIGRPKPMVTALAPVVKNGRYAGYVTGILDLDRVDAMVALSIQGASLPGLGYTLLDRNNRVIVSSNKNLQLMSGFSRAQGEVRKVDAAVSLWLPPHAKNISVSERWEKAFYFLEMPIAGVSGWKLILEQPMAPFQKLLYERYTFQLMWIFGMLVVALMIAELMSRSVSRALERLGTISADLPARIERGEVPAWPETHIIEARRLTANMQDMADAIVHQFGSIRAMNETLEERIAERTRELLESEEKYRFLIEATGTGYVIIDTQGRVREANREYARMTGHGSVEDILGRAVTEWTAPHDRARNAEEVRKCMQNGFVRNLVIDYVGDNGRITPVEIHATVLKGPVEARIFTICRDITERRHNEEQLLESEERFRSLFENVQVAALVIDPVEGSILDANAAAAAYYGWSRKELRSMTVSQINTLSPEQVQQEMQAARTQQRNYFLFRHRRADGSVRDVEVFSGPIPSGGKTVLYSIVHDITVRRNAERRLADAMNYIQTLIEASPIGILTYRATGEAISVNAAAARIVGTTKDLLLSQNFRELDSWKQSGLFDAADRAIKTNREQAIELAHTTTFENRIILAGHFVPFTFGGMPHLLLIAQDITERKQAEENLRAALEQLERFREALDGVMAHIYIKDLQSRYTYANRSTLELFGCSAEELLGKGDEHFFPPETARQLREVDLRVFSGIRNEQEINVSGSGPVVSNRAYWEVKTPLYADPEHRTVVGLLGISTDITERKQAERALRESEYRYRTLADRLPLAVQVFSPEGFTLRVNEAWERMWQTPFSTLKGYNVLQDRQLEALGIMGLLKQAFTGQTVEFPVHEYDRQQTPDMHSSGKLWLHTFAYPVLGEHGQVLEVVVIHEDVTERKQAEASIIEKTRQLEDLTRNLEQRVREEIALRSKNEQMLIQQSKLAAMGEMLGAIAHQWRQPLNALGLIVQNLRDAHTYGELDAAHLDTAVAKAMAQVRHMSKTIDDFRNFFQPDKEKTTFDTMQATGEVLSLFAAQLAAHNISFHLTCRTHGRTFDSVESIVPCPEKSISGFRNEFEHVLLNLINNARDAIVERMERGAMPQDKGHIALDFRSEDGRIVIEVSDNGGGIPDGIIDRIFEPYFTTKDPSRGTGLGLYMASVIIEEHMLGTLSAANSGNGAVFTITLPRA